MTTTNKPEALSPFPRVRRFLHRPWNQKVESIKNRLKSAVSNIPVPVRLPLGFWWMKKSDRLTELLLEGSFESAELAFVTKFLQPGMTVLDIGAHHGLYTLLASRCVGRPGRVFAFEPSPRERRALRLHLTLNNCRNVSVQSVALGSEDAETHLYVAEPRHSGLNSLRPPGEAVGVSPLRVTVARLDDWIAAQGVDRVDFIKLDVEGGELAALQGASQLLRRPQRPVIFVEVQDVRTLPWGYPAKRIIDLVEQSGYAWFALTEEGKPYRLDTNATQFEGNFVALPRERLGSQNSFPFTTP